MASEFLPLLFYLLLTICWNKHKDIMVLMMKDVNSQRVAGLLLSELQLSKSLLAFKIGTGCVLYYPHMG